MQIAKSIIILLSILFISTQLKAQEGAVIDEVVAIVGNNMILHSNIESQYYQYKQQQVYVDGDVRCKIFEDLLYQKLLIHQAAIDSLEITDKEVETNLDSRLEYFIQQIGSVEKLEEYFGKSLYKIKADFEDIIRDQLTAQRMEAKITEDVSIAPSEVQKYFNSIPHDSLPLINTQIELYQIYKYPEQDEATLTLVKEKLNRYREQIIKGEREFGTLATLYSEDPGSAQNNGELGLIGRAYLDKDFAEAAFKLEPNEVSEVVESAFGFHIIQLIERKGEQINCRHILLKPKILPAQRMAAFNYLDSLSKVIKNDTLTFPVAANLYSEDKDTRGNNGLVVNPYTGNAKFEISNLDAATNYAIKNMNVGEISEPFESIDDNGKAVYKIVQIKSKKEPHIANLKDDYNQIKDLALAQKKQTLINEWIIEKQKKAYIRIDDKYRDCEFEIGQWIK